MPQGLLIRHKGDRIQLAEVNTFIQVGHKSKEWLEDNSLEGDSVYVLQSVPAPAPPLEEND